MNEYRKIIHIDMDAFFASVEQRDTPEYRGKPLVVGSANARGVIAAASYEARKFGIHSAMSSQRAKELCPHLIFANVRMETYKSVSKEIHEIFRQYTDLIEPISLDEAFLDVTENKQGIVLAKDIALRIKQEIKNTLHLTASAGVSYNKFLAKVASDMQKPDGLTIIHPQKAQTIIDALPIEAFWGVGKVTAKKMHAMGIYKGEDIRNNASQVLRANFGKIGAQLLQFANGEDHRLVKPHRVRKSVGCERTFQEDIVDTAQMTEHLMSLSEELQKRVSRTHFIGKTLVLKIKRDDFRVLSRSITVKGELNQADVFYNLSKNLLMKINFLGHGVRLLGLSVINPILSIQERKTKQLLLPFA